MEKKERTLNKNRDPFLQEYDTVKQRNVGSHSKNDSHFARDSHENGFSYSESFFKGLFLRTLCPLFLITMSPIFIMLVWFTVAHCEGSYGILCQKFAQNGIFNTLESVWSNVSIFDPTTIIIFFLYIFFQVCLMKFMPGKTVYGPLTPKGNRPIYKDNGLYCYLATLTTFLVIALCLRTFTSHSITLVFDHFDQMLTTLNILSLIFCVLLCIKGYYFPTTSDCGSSGNFIFDYYWGTELYPRVCGIDIKVLTNCRFGMTVWSLLVMVFAFKNYETYGFVPAVWVSTALQTIYFFKFFCWETGYMSTIDIMVDRAGFYICWGCLVFISGLYASVSLYLAKCPESFGDATSLLILIIGLASCFVNYWADLQKQWARRSDGKCTIWGKKADVIVAEYKLLDGTKKNSLLLVSGFWGLSRHFHYLPELTLAICWSIPCGFTHVMPYSYFIVLFIILIHRTYRDDTKCQKKYGKYWSEYCKQVPYKIIPYVF